jgi:hypothetical protein
MRYLLASVALLAVLAAVGCGGQPTKPIVTALPKDTPVFATPPTIPAPSK